MILNIFFSRNLLLSFQQAKGASASLRFAKAWFCSPLLASTGLPSQKRGSAPVRPAVAALRLLPFVILIFLLLVVPASAQVIPIPPIGDQSSPRDVAVSLQIILLFTVLTLAPSILMVMTSFTRIVIVFHFLRTAMGTAQMPPNQVLVGMALLLTFFIMTPVFSQVRTEALQPYFNNEITFTEMTTLAKKPIRSFLIANTQKKDLALFLELSRSERPATMDDIPDHVVVASFVLSEIQVAFQIGFLLFLPFLIIDFVVASVLLSMGMMMLPPVMISVPFKILLFIMVDGWGLLITSLVKSYYFTG